MNTAVTPPLPTRIAVLGIGMMGFPMARRLCEAGCEVSVWNRSRAKAERLQPFGATVADTPAEAVAQADVVITLLEHGGVVQDVLFEQGADLRVRYAKQAFRHKHLFLLVPPRSRRGNASDWE